ncbi:MAG: XRE family transcriptional regulator [Tabrizicola sp.]|nr:XRE family transcriptional regulator [Tabrizicola sp.]MDP3262093.1 XRE family transcriptional regulator [Tabrizicola sp.]MDP3648161.1 XRE family transcriptional regulator [Paracoccaceae bacterium]MDZ4068588.1 XRE family transcriptional regulator [Tabrizicola sp.]
MSADPCKDSDLAQFIAKGVLELRPKMQADIAAEAGFVNGNYLSMLKAGNSKLALDRVPALAAALECDPALLMRLALEQAVGSTAALALREILGTPVSANERLWLAEIRDAAGQIDPRPTARARATIRGLFGK